MEKKDTFVVGAIVVFLVVILFSVLADYVGQIANSDELLTEGDEINVTNNYSSFITHLGGNSSTSTLSPIGEGITNNNVTRYNLTWLEFTNNSVNASVFIGDYKEIGMNKSMGFALSVWINPVNQVYLNNRQIFGTLDKNCSEVGRFGLSMGNGTSGFFNYAFFGVYNTTACFRVASTSPLELSVWHHVVGVHNNSHLNLYIDGLLNNSLAFPGGVLNTTSTRAVYIGGGNATTNNSFKGFIDEVAYFNNSLNITEVQAVYGLGR